MRTERIDGRFAAVPANNGLLDASNLRILAELQLDARMTMAELGRRVGLSAPAVAERVARLEAEGVITGYRAQIAPRALGLDLGVVIRVRPASRMIDKVAAAARDAVEVVLCERITGDDCFWMRAYVRDVDHLEELIDRFTPFGQTTTSVVQSAPVSPRGPALPAA